MRRQNGFTLLEMLVVMTVVGLLLSIVAPRYTEQVDRSREVVLRRNLAGIREAIDQFKGDRARYPKDLQELVLQRYLRAIPTDPLTDRADTWKLVSPAGQDGALFDVRSGAAGLARDGSAYATW